MLKGNISTIMAVVIINLFKAVDITQDQGKLLLLSFSAVYLVIDKLLNAAPVRQVGQWVMMGKMFDLGLGFFYGCYIR